MDSTDAHSRRPGDPAREGDPKQEPQLDTGAQKPADIVN